MSRTNDPSELTGTDVAPDYGKEVDGSPTPDVPPPMVFNNCYLYHGEENVFLTVDDLMRFASQAANGMVRPSLVTHVERLRIS